MGRPRGHYRQSFARDNISLALGSLLSLLLCALLALCCTSLGVLNEAALVRCVDDTYVEYTLRYVEDQARYYTLPTGIDPEVLEGLFSPDTLRHDIVDGIGAAFAQVDFAPDTQWLQDELAERVVSNMPETAQAQEAARAYASEVGALYVDVVQVSGVDALARVARGSYRAIQVGVVGLCVLAAILVVLVVRLHHFLHRSLRYVAYSFWGAALMGAVAPVMLIATKPYAGLNISSQHLYYLCVMFVEQALRLFVVGAGVYALIALCLMAAVYLQRKRALRGKLKHSRRSTGVTNP